jgi:hypothetical protein
MVTVMLPSACWVTVQAVIVGYAGPTWPVAGQRPCSVSVYDRDGPLLTVRSGM